MRLDDEIQIRIKSPREKHFEEQRAIWAQLLVKKRPDLAKEILSHEESKCDREGNNDVCRVTIMIPMCHIKLSEFLASHSLGIERPSAPEFISRYIFVAFMYDFVDDIKEAMEEKKG